MGYWNSFVADLSALDIHSRTLETDRVVGMKIIFKDFTIEGTPREMRLFLGWKIPKIGIATKPKEEPKIERRGKKRSVSLQQIKQIKQMIQENPKIKDNMIAKLLNLTRDQVRYWRIHTPKNLRM